MNKNTNMIETLELLKSEKKKVRAFAKKYFRKLNEKEEIIFAGWAGEYEDEYSVIINCEVLVYENDVFNENISNCYLIINKNDRRKSHCISNIDYLTSYEDVTSQVESEDVNNEEKGENDMCKVKIEKVNGIILETSKYVVKNNVMSSLTQNDIDVIMNNVNTLELEHLKFSTFIEDLKEYSFELSDVNDMFFNFIQYCAAFKKGLDINDAYVIYDVNNEDIDKVIRNDYKGKYKLELVNVKSLNMLLEKCMKSSIATTLYAISRKDGDISEHEIRMRQRIELSEYCEDETFFITQDKKRALECFYSNYYHTDTDVCQNSIHLSEYTLYKIDVDLDDVEDINDIDDVLNNSFNYEVIDCSSLFIHVRDMNDDVFFATNDISDAITQMNNYNDEIDKLNNVLSDEMFEYVKELKQAYIHFAY